MDEDFYSEFNSLFNETYKIAFDKKGRSMRGTSKKCFHFLKNFDFDIHQKKKEHGPKFNPNKMIHYLRKEKVNRKRRALLSSWNSR